HRLGLRVQQILGLVEVADYSAETVGGADVDVGNQARLGDVLQRYQSEAEPGPARRQDSGQHAADRPDRAVESQLAEDDGVAEAGDGQVCAGREHGDGDGRIEAGAVLADVGWAEVDRDARLRP